MGHTFHIPVMGLAFSIDTPLSVAPYGISSAVSIVDDELIERMRQHHCQRSGRDYCPISKHQADSRAKRITAYLNLLQELIDEKVLAMQSEPLEAGTPLSIYFELLPERDPLKQLFLTYQQVIDAADKAAIKAELLAHMRVGSVDVNIMAKVDKVNRVKAGEDAAIHSDALAALRGYAKSRLCSSLILSAGMNPHLYSYLTQFDDFYPDQSGRIKKKVVLKVSDYRSAFIQARFLAKKGIWVSEFRIESGLNCGGHAFATDGYLLGPILEEFKVRRDQLYTDVFTLCQQALHALGRPCPEFLPVRFTAQGGIGTSEEHEFLRSHYLLDSVGWGSPFLLVPEVTNLDDETLKRLVGAASDDFYVSEASPLGVPFNNFRKSTAEEQRLQRIAKGKPGSPCTKKYLISNTEFSAAPICTASRAYQQLKLKQLQMEGLSETDHAEKTEAILAKTCLCEGLAVAAYLKNGLLKPKEDQAVAICPGPNLAWFSGPYRFKELVDHIYGRACLIEREKRPPVFINELRLYVSHLERMIRQQQKALNEKKRRYLLQFKQQLLEGIAYYQSILPVFEAYKGLSGERMALQLAEIKAILAYRMPV